MTRKRPARRRRRTILLTGFPAFTAKRMLQRILAEPGAHVIVLVQERFIGDLEAFSNTLSESARKRVEALTGDVAAVDLGLSGDEVRRIFDEVTEIYHMAAIYHLGVPREQAFRVNVEGTRNVLELAGSMHALSRIHHFSTAFVSGRREGVISEEDLSDRYGFHNHFEETRFRAEVLVQRAMREIPITVYRPSIIVGDSQTGEIDKFAGPYYFMIAIVSAPIEIPLPLPGPGDAPLNLVPIDYVIEAAYAIGRDPRSVGRTFHLVDRHPLPGRRICELVAERAGKPPPRGVIPGGRLLWDAVSGLITMVPSLERFLSTPRQAFDQFHHHALYDAAGAAELLEGTDIVCPPFETYVDRVVRFIQEFYENRKRQRKEEPLYDPLY
jgi:nucleoside-diphosphate-sugar epimerase